MRTLVRLASWIVPAAQRPRWYEEWLAEVAEARQRGGEVAAVRMAAGAFSDACAVRRVTSSVQRRRWSPVQGTREDLRNGLRALRREPTFALGVIASLSLGMAATVSAFTFANALTVRPFPHVRNQHELVEIRPGARLERGRRVAITSTMDDYRAFRDGMSGVAALTGHTSGTIALTIRGQAQTIRAASVTSNYFDALGVRPALGRFFGSDPADREVVVISHALWLRQFASAPDVLGQFVTLGSTGAARVIGVTPRDFVGVSQADIGMGGPGIDLWMPMDLGTRTLPTAMDWRTGQPSERARHIRLVGRAKPGVSLVEIQAQAAAVVRGLEEVRPAEWKHGGVSVRRVWISPADEHLPIFLAVLSVPMLVLIIGCINAANLLLARGTRRMHEFAVKLALGASRWRVIRPLLIESALLALLAGAVCMPLAIWGLSFVRTYVELPMPVDARVVAFTATVALVSAIGFSLAPAVRMSATTPSILMSSSRSHAEAPGASRVRRALVCAQVALGLGLLTTGGQLITFVAAQVPAAGTRSDRLLLASFDMGQLRIADAEARESYARLLDGVGKLRGVTAVGIARRTAVWTFGRLESEGGISVWRPDELPNEGLVWPGGYVDGALFEAVGLALEQGRVFDSRDRAQFPAVAVINTAAAGLLFGERPALGQMLRVRPYPAAKEISAHDVTVIGVIESAVESTYSDRPLPALYLPSPLSPEPRLSLYIRTDGSNAEVAAGLRELVRVIDARLPVLEIRTLEELAQIRLFPERTVAMGVSLLGLVGLLLAAGGLYGVMSYLVALRSHELGVRLALGADPTSLLRLTMMEALRLIGWGAAIGGLGGWLASRLVQHEIEGAGGMNPWYFLLALGLLAAMMLLASAVPARRAARVDPLQVLRTE